ncbi:MAG TPA: hypothetical protein VGN09_09900 [Vicinamibacteria bacterium]
MASLAQPVATAGPTATPAATPGGTCAARFDNGSPKSTWAFFGANDKLSYRAIDSRGDTIVDFSHAGYGGGGVRLPAVPVAETLAPSGGDDTAAIRGALTRVSTLPLVKGFRGAVRLGPGTWRVTGPLSIDQSGVVLRGSGSGPTGTVINLGGTPFRFISITGSGSATTSNAVSITDPYVPSGARSFDVSSAAGFDVGDTVYVQRTVTSPWIHFMDMDTLVRGGKPQTWISPGTVINTDRRIAAISGNHVTLDVPLTDSIDSTYLSPPGGRLVKYSWPGRISNVGLEGVRIVAPPQGTSLREPRFQLSSMDAVVDAWVKDVYFKDCVDCASVSRGAKRVTIEDVTIQHTGAVSDAPYPADFSLSGTQVLAHRCTSLNARNVYTVVAQASATGPIVVLNYRSTEQKGVEPHQRWAVGMLLDNIDVDGDLNLMNRGYYGSGHGWTVGWAVAWNTTAHRYIVQRPPGALNWSIGGSGAIHDQARPGRAAPIEPRGEFELHGTKVSPWSLYLAQLCSRLGPQAVANIGY